ncbi:YusW family protein [Halobacillus salinarum]|uniref:YusW family protein n=1 Tax=Halobacillus salinarum TaxID=2932257 RepID=A0ABY4EFG2_9BACI|nr:YusW family protein [Halobacillus salinarum]UOQ42808.1 YusW family protein [Halobacillus salinarum]
MMKPIVTVIVLFTLLITGCAKEETVPEPKGFVTKKIAYSGKNANEQVLPFTRFDLNINYGQQGNYKIHFLSTANRSEGAIYDFNKQTVFGKEAVDQLVTNFHNFAFDEDSSKEFVITEVLSNLGLSDNFRDIHLQVRYLNGQVKTYHQQA